MPDPVTGDDYSLTTLQTHHPTTARNIAARELVPERPEEPTALHQLHGLVRVEGAGLPAHLSQLGSEAKIKGALKP